MFFDIFFKIFTTILNKNFFCVWSVHLCLFLGCGLSLKMPGDGDLLWLSLGWQGSPPESQPLEILHGTGKDVGGSDGG